MAHFRPEPDERPADGDPHCREGRLSCQIRNFRISEAELDAGDDELPVGLPQPLERELSASHRRRPQIASLKARAPNSTLLQL